MQIVAGIIAIINPHQKEALIVALVVCAIVLVATFAKDLTAFFK